MPAPNPIDWLLHDLDTITEVAQAGVITRRETRLESGENRPAAILYLDLVGFTDLSRMLPPENLSKLLDRAFRIFELTVKSQGGYCDKVIGDAALYVFPGHPNHPPACEGALRAAVALLDRARQISESLKATGLLLSVRIGISFGEVARKVVGGDEQQLTVIGDTVNIAQRLEASAQPGTIQTTVRVLDRAGEFAVSQPRGELELKGFGVVKVHYVLSFRSAPVQLRGSFRRLTPLIGRDEVLDQALAKVEEWLGTRYPAESLDITTTVSKVAGRNRLMIFRGEAAVGKSRLVYELIEKLRDRHHVHSTTGHCTADTSLSTFAAEVAQITSITPESLPDSWNELCGQASEHLGESYGERQRMHMPMLAYLLDAEQVDTLSVSQADANSFVLEVKLALRACCELIGIVTGQPVLLVVEDLQWMGELRDVVTDLLKFTCLPQPLIVIGTARPEYEPLAGELGEGDMAVFNLDPLSQNHGRAMIEALLPGLVLPPVIERELHEKAIGLPYYYEEFARLLVRRKLVQEHDGRYILTAQIEDLAIPENIRMLILGRLDQLEPDLRALVGRASVLGRSFLKGLLARFEEQLGTSDPERLERSLAALTLQQVLGEEPGDRYFFEHVLTREAAYSALLTTNRSVLHGVAAQVLGELLVPGTAAEWDILPELTRHLEEVGNYVEAHKRACDMLALMAHTGRYEQWAMWEERARRSWELARHLDPSLPEISGHLLSILGWQNYCRGRMAEAEQYYSHALAIARRTGDRRVEGHTLNNLGTLYRNQGKVDQAQHCYEQSQEVLRKLGDRLGEGTLLRNLGILHKLQGRMRETRECYEQSLAIKREVGDHRGEGIALNNLGMLHRDQGRMAAARECLEQSLLIKRETSDRRGEAITLCNMGQLHAAQGRIEEARGCYEMSLSICREIGDRRREGTVLNYIGALYQGLDRPEEARSYYETALAISREVSDRDGEGLTLSNLGSWLSWQGDTDEAEAIQLEALDIGRRLGLRHLEGQVLAELADVYRKQGRLAEAREALWQAAEILVAMSDFYYLCMAHCYWVYCYLAEGEIEGAQSALNKAQTIAQQIGSGPHSELGRYIARARNALENADGGTRSRR